jgi:hypothetical protein
MAKKFEIRRVTLAPDGSVTEAIEGAAESRMEPQAGGGEEGDALVGPVAGSDGSALGLTPAQRVAIEKLTVGETVVDAARAAGVTRMTLHRWLKQDAAFVAAYNAWQQDALASARGRLLALADTAVTTVGNAMRAGDTRTALAILKAMGTLEKAAPGPTDEQEVQHDLKVEEERARRKRFIEKVEVL